MNTPKRDEHVAVIYVHGMGEQRRFEETARLVDALDINLKGSPTGNGEFIYDIQPGIEKLRTDNKGGLVKYISASYRDGSGGDSKFRFYEAYWAPLVAKGRNPLDVFKWMYGLVLNPWRTATSPWRERQRLRAAHLYRYAEETGVDEKLIANLAMCYHRFEGPAAREKYKDGRFADFIDFICNGATKEGDDPAIRKYEDERRPDAALIEPLIALAHKWKAAYLRAEMLKLFALISIALGLTLTILAVLFILTQIISLVVDTGPSGTASTFWALFQEKIVDAGPIGLLLILAGLFGPARFLSRFLGDVQFWTTYEETDEKHQIRREILQSVTRIIKHVLKDTGDGPLCTRCVIVSHSLGTSIAYEAVLDVLHLNRATFQHGDVFQGDVEIKKISHFVTIASPIDKIHYLFESSPHSFHRYNRFVDDLRGDITSAPFSNNEKPHTHWINYWDQGDIISDPLYTPFGPPKKRSEITDPFIELRPDNVRSSILPFFSPAAAHEIYFRRRDILDGISDMIFKNEFNFTTAEIEMGEGRQYQMERIGDIDQRRSTLSAAKASLIALPWLALFAIIGQYADNEFLMLGSLTILIACVAFIILPAGANDTAVKDSLISKLR